MAALRPRWNTGLASLRWSWRAYIQKVLEVGVGPGQILLEVPRRVDRTNWVYGLDLSWMMLAKARQCVRRAGYGNVSLEEADSAVALR